MRKPSVILAGGSQADATRIVPRLVGIGLDVHEHWTLARGENWPAFPGKARVQAIVVVKDDRLPKKLLDRLYNLQDAHGIRVVRWDWDWTKAKRFLSEAGLVPGDKEKREVLGVPPKEAHSAPVQLQDSRMADGLRAAMELVGAELAKDPLFRGLTLYIEDDGRAAVKMVPRQIEIALELRALPEPRPSIPPPIVAANLAMPPPEPGPESTPKRGKSVNDLAGLPKHKHRPKDRLETLRNLAAEYIKANPKCAVTSIVSFAGANGAKELQWPLKQLKAEGKIRTEGSRGATRYFWKEGAA